jgi:Arc/MetJ-type ribon-helix-helix transcriptional regulator
MAQFVTRVEERLTDRVDSLIAAGVFASRSEAVRVGLERIVDEVERRRIGQEIVEAYRRMPQTDEELAWADEAAVRMISDEPW